MSATSAKVTSSVDATIGPRASPSLGACLSFGVGTIGTAVLLNTVTVYLPAFMTTVLGRSAALAGILLTASKLYDILCDIAIGLASDRTRSRLGRRRPYLLAGALLGAFTFCLIFNPPAIGDHWIIWEMGALLVLYSTGYSLFNVPYLAIPAEMSDDYHGRTRLLSFRTFFVAVGQFVGLSVSGWMLQHLGGGRAGYATMGYCLAAVVLVTELGTFFGLRTMPIAPVTISSARGSLESFLSLFRNSQYALLMGAKFVQLLGVSVSISTSLLFMLNVLGAGYAGQANFSLAQNVAIAFSMLFWVRVSRRIGKRVSAMIAIVIYALVSLSWLMAGAGEPTLFIVIRGMVMGIGAGGILLMGASMLPDTMEYDYSRTGIRREGIYSSGFAIIEKAAFAIGPGLIGIYLSRSGYIPTLRGHLVRQPDSVHWALYVGTAILPAIMVLASTVFLSFYNLSEEKLNRLRPNVRS